MHYCVYLFTKEEPTEKEIEKIMEPYAEPEAPIFAPISWDWYSIGGRFKRLETKSGFMCDGAPVSELDSSELSECCYAFITQSGIVVSSELWVWNRWITNPYFKEQFQEAIEQYANGYLTMLDIHS